MMVLKFETNVQAIVWHYKGDYFATICPQAGSSSIAIHQLSKASTQRPFTKSPGLVQTVMFHPTRPFLFVVTQQHVKIYHLIEQKLMKKLLTGCKWLSSVDIHPSGDHIVLGMFIIIFIYMTIYSILLFICYINFKTLYYIRIIYFSI